MNNLKQEIKEEIIEDILKSLTLEIDTDNPYCDRYKILKIELKYNGTVICSDEINVERLEAE